DSGITVFAVLAPSALQPGLPFFFDFGDWANHEYAFMYDYKSYGSAVCWNYGGGGVLNDSQAMYGHANGTNPVVYTGVIRFTDRTIVRINGKEQTSGSRAKISNIRGLTAAELTDSATQTGGAGPVVIGGQSKAINAARSYQGAIAEIRWYSAGLTDAQCSTIENELYKKYIKP
ncbi:MAG TPA: hypothetical protein VHV83_22665, partial [Armatimonadota bacterium]|nr:hypothetical protein [Armatimonadota bacterium]